MPSASNDVPNLHLDEHDAMIPTQQAKTEGAHNVIVQGIGDGINITIGSPHLTLIPPRSRTREIRTEIDLLNAYCRSIALVGREADMQSLWEWLHSTRPVAVRTLKGRASGSGKTRTASLFGRESIKRWSFKM
jgi:hypothetical protein